jgi:hypothetical protein
MITATDDNGSQTKYVTFPIVTADVSWSATVTGIPTTLTRNSAMTAFTLFDSVIDAPTDKTFSVVGAKPSWLNLNTSSGQVSGTPTAEDAEETTVTFRIRETGNASNAANIDVTFPAVGAGSTYGTVALGTQTSNQSVAASSAINISTHSASMTGGGNLIYSATNLTGSDLDIDPETGAITAAIDIANAGTYSNIIITAQDDSAYCTATYYATCRKSFAAFNITISGGAETVDFTTAVALPSASADDDIDEQIVAEGSQGSEPIYTFVSTSNTGNSNTSTDTPFKLTGNTISGIAPRLFNAATYSFEIQASINAGAVTNNRTFTLLISQDSSCVSPTSNICT